MFTTGVCSSTRVLPAKAAKRAAKKAEENERKAKEKREMEEAAAGAGDSSGQPKAVRLKANSYQLDESDFAVLHNLASFASPRRMAVFAWDADLAVACHLGQNEPFILRPKKRYSIKELVPGSALLSMCMKA